MGYKGDSNSQASILGNRQLGYYASPESSSDPCPAYELHRGVGGAGLGFFDAALRWDATAVKHKSFVGRNELIEQHVGLETYTKGRYFFLPETNIDPEPRGLPAGPVRDRLRERPCGAHEHVPACHADRRHSGHHERPRVPEERGKGTSGGVLHEGEISRRNLHQQRRAASACTKCGAHSPLARCRSAGALLT